MMKQFLYTLLRFSILPLLVLLLLEGSIAWQGKNLFSEKRLDKVFANSTAPYQWISNLGSNNKVLLLGSSTVKFGLNCTRLNKLSHDSLAFVNLAAEARDPIESYFILKQLDLNGVKAVYFAVDPWIFCRNYYRYRKNYFYLDMSIPVAVKYSMDQDPRLFPKRYKGLFNTLLLSSSYVKDSLTVPAGFGTAVLNQKPTNFGIEVHKRFRIEDYGWSDLQFEYLQKMALLCKSRNISFTAFYTPKRSDFIVDYKKNCDRIHDEFLEKLKAAGFTDPIIGNIEELQSYGDSLFADAYHLNGRGQEVYAERFFRLITD